MGLTNSLKSVDLLGVLLAHLHDFAERALANNSQQLKIINGERLVFVGLIVDANVKFARATGERDRAIEQG